MFHLYKVILFISLIFTYPAFGVSISVSSICDNRAMPYNFSQYSYDPDITIKFSSYATNPDFTFKEVMSKVDSDIVLEDDSVADISVCKSNKGKTIKISNYLYDPDFTIKISNNAYDPDYTIFNDSKILTTEEVISIIVLRSFNDID
jgi:hypothetical protein